VGQVTISDKGDSFDITLMDGRRETVVISPARTSSALYGWVGPVGQMTPQTMQFTFTPQRGFMKDDKSHNNAEYIFLQD